MTTALCGYPGPFSSLFSPSTAPTRSHLCAASFPRSAHSSSQKLGHLFVLVFLLKVFFRLLPLAPSSSSKRVGTSRIDDVFLSFQKLFGVDIFRHGSSSFLGQDGGRPSRRRTVKMPRGKAKRRPTNSPSESSAVPFFPTIAETNKKVGSTAHQTNNWPALTVFSPNRQTADGTASRQQLGRLISEKCQPTLPT